MPVIPNLLIASLRAYKRSSLKMISTLVNLGPTGFLVLAAGAASTFGITLTETASAGGTLPVTTTVSSLM